MEKMYFFTLEHLQDRYAALFLEFASFDLNIAISVVMARNNLHGKANYDLIEKSMCDGIIANAPKDETYQNFAFGVVRKQRRVIVEGYFLRDREALNVSHSDICAYCLKRELDLASLPEDQTGIVLFSIRLARAIGVDLITNLACQSFAEMGLNKIAVCSAFEFQTQVLNGVG
jgi:hypothetical protein